MLAKSLVDRLSASNDYEELMKLNLFIIVTKFYILNIYFRTRAVLHIRTSKLQKMFQDVKLSETLLDQYRTYCKKEKIDNIEQHNARKLIWLHQHSKGDLQILYTNKKYILNVSIYQMAALLLFNKLLSWIVDQIQDETQIKIDLFFQVLYSLLKSKLITCYEINKNQFDEYFNESCIKMNYIIHINENFQSLKKNILFLIRNRE
ncbi:unnamed protein product [Rotaria sp. Silwood1]|nr:unnamed protein product [Rotaria sp. Silwood1]CAF1676477.1 unnamed protein product [Rotaria sp. Silwood1]